MKDSVLVVYATVAGATAEIAAEIAATMREAGLSVEVKPAAEVSDVAPYQVVVLGTPIYMGQVQKEITAFATQHQAALRKMYVRTFAVSGTVRDGKPEAYEAVTTAMAPVNEIVGVEGSQIFAGRIAYKHLSFLHRAIAKMMKAEEGDWRDWSAIREWASTVVAQQQVTI